MWSPGQQCREGGPSGRGLDLEDSALLHGLLTSLQESSLIKSSPFAVPFTLSMSSHLRLMHEKTLPDTALSPGFPDSRNMSQYVPVRYKFLSLVRSAAQDRLGYAPSSNTF